MGLPAKLSKRNIVAAHHVYSSGLAVSEDSKAFKGFMLSEMRTWGVTLIRTTISIFRYGDRCKGSQVSAICSHKSMGV